MERQGRRFATPQGGVARLDARRARVALVHDFLVDVRGAERVFTVMCDMWPGADVFTAIYDERGTEGRFRHRDVNTSFLQKMRPTAKTFRAYLPLYPYAMESLDLSGYDLVVSSSSAWAHGVIVDPGTVHVCYCHNPFRYAWNAREATLRDRAAPSRAALAAVLSRWRRWDRSAAQQVDRYVANSVTTQDRIRRYFGRDADVVHPPVDTARFRPRRETEIADHWLVVSELMPHKRIEVAVAAFNRLRRPLVVVGDGPDARRLERLAGPTIRFEGRVSDARVTDLLGVARGLVVTATEEFGIAAVEAQASGRPVVALRDGGVCETVVEGETGAFYDTPDADELAAAVRGIEGARIDPAACVANAERFGVASFEAGLRAAVAATCAEAGTARGAARPLRRPLPLGRAPRRG